MGAESQIQTQIQKGVTPTLSPVKSGLLQRRCACGQHTIAGGECAECRQQREDRILRTAAGPVPDDVIVTGPRPPASPLDPTAAFEESRFGRDFSHVRVRAVAPEQIQTKLTVGQPGDVYEQEADQAAEAVMRIPRPGAPTNEASAHRQRVRIDASQQLRRQPAPERREDEEEDEEEKTIRTKEAPGHTPAVTPEIEDRLDRMRGGGQPLPGSLRDFFESRFGYDVGQVRVHTSPEAARVAQDLNAYAFTRGQDIFFGAGRFQLHTPSGQRLLAHELAHTLQQRQGGSSVVLGQIQRQAARAATPATARETAPLTSPLGATIASDTPEQTATGARPASRPTREPRRTTPGEPAGVRAERPAGEAAPGAQPTTPTPEGAPATEGTGEASLPETTTIDTSGSAALLPSLATIPPASFAEAVNSATQSVAQIQAQEQADLQASLPEIDRPTGLPRLSERPESEPTQLEPGQAPEAPAPGAREEPPPDTRHEEPRGPVPASQVSTAVSEPADESGGSWWDWLFSTVRRFLGRLPTTDPGLSTSTGDRPTVDTTGDADPTLMRQQQQESDQEVATHRAEADAAVRADFGENAIYPDVPHETLRPIYTPSPLESARNGAVRTPEGVPGQVRAGFNRSATGWLSGEVQQRVQQEQQDRAEYERQSQQAREDSQRQIDEETARVRAEQEAAQQQARRDVTDQREQWREENRRIQESYSTQAETQRQTVNQQIQTEVRTTDERANQELTRAEEQAERERRQTEEQAEAKKREAENRPRSFWDRLRGAVSDFFDSLKAAVNFLFDELRRRVKQLIEGAKRLVRGLIEATRRAIVGFIRGFGEFLKGVVSVALAAFPETAARARAWIDRRVNGAVDVVNRAADALKEFASRVLDALGAALDFVLSVYQRAYLLLLDGLKFLAVGLIDIMERIGHLVEAASQMPDHFLGQVSEELIGQDLTQPLAFERTRPPTPQAAVATAVATGALPAQDAALMTQTAFRDTDLAVDQVAPLDLDPAFIASLNLQDGEEREFGESSDPTRSIQAILAEHQAEAAATLTPGAAPISAAQPGVAEPGTAEPETEVEPEPGAATTAAGTEPPSEAGAEEDVEARLQAMMAQEPEPPCPKEASSERAQEGAVPEEMKFGPLTVGQRARYLTNQMIKGVRNWFSCNWPWLLAAAIGVLTVLVVAEILTGGAITAALPAIMELVALIMIGVAAIRVAAYVGEYLTKGWDGDILGAAKSLARGLAVGAIELVFTLLFDLNAVLKAAKQGLTATLKGALATAKASARTLATSGRRIARAAVRTVRAPGRAAALVGRAVVRRGRIILQGARRGFERGVRSLDDLARRLWDHVRFRKFKIRIEGRRIRLYGYINPWVLLADGSLVPVEVTGGRPALGEVVGFTGRRKGIIVGVVDENASAAVRELQALSPAQRRARFREFSRLTQDDIRRALTNRETTAQLRKGIPGAQPAYFNAHHVVPRELRKNARIKSFLDDIGYNIEDGARNGIMLPPNRTLALQHTGWEKATLHFTSHPNYTQRVAQRINAIAGAYERSIAAGMPRSQAVAEANRLLDQYLTRLKSGLMNGTVPLN